MGFPWQSLGLSRRDHAWTTLQVTSTEIKKGTWDHFPNTCTYQTMRIPMLYERTWKDFFSAIATDESVIPCYDQQLTDGWESLLCLFCIVLLWWALNRISTYIYRSAPLILPHNAQTQMPKCAGSILAIVARWESELDGWVTANQVCNSFCVYSLHLDCLSSLNMAVVQHGSTVVSERWLQRLPSCSLEARGWAPGCSWDFRTCWYYSADAVVHISSNSQREFSL